jgi:hypothetical protein
MTLPRELRSRLTTITNMPTTTQWAWAGDVAVHTVHTPRSHILTTAVTTKSSPTKRGIPEWSVARRGIPGWSVANTPGILPNRCRTQMESEAHRPPHVLLRRQNRPVPHRHQDDDATSAHSCFTAHSCRT